jgi:hypothetical protein
MYLSADRLGQPQDPVAALGESLWREAPAGVTVAIYYDDPEQKRIAIDWAARERAIGPRRTQLVAAELEFGRAIADGKNLTTQLTQLGTALRAAVSAVPAPTNVTPLPGTGPSLIRTLALFTHGTRDWISIGGGITTKSVGALIGRIAPVLSNDVKILLYGCSSARGQLEASDWVRTTTSGGGTDSLAAKFRDGLVDAGKTQATVWGHTEVGHTTRNPSLRYFFAGRGKGAEGQSYLDEIVFGVLADALVREEIAETIASQGYTIPELRQDAFRTVAAKHIKRLRYVCYVGAVIRTSTVGGKVTRTTNLTVRGTNLPEVAPLYPLEVADVVRRRWADTCWTAAARTQAAQQLIKELRLPKQPQPQPTP